MSSKNVTATENRHQTADTSRKRVFRPRSVLETFLNTLLPRSRHSGVYCICLIILEVQFQVDVFNATIQYSSSFVFIVKCSMPMISFLVIIVIAGVEERCCFA